MEALVKFFERKLHVAVDKHHKALKGEICKLCNEVAHLCSAVYGVTSDDDM